MITDSKSLGKRNFDAFKQQNPVMKYAFVKRKNGSHTFGPGFSTVKEYTEFLLGSVLTNDNYYHELPLPGRPRRLVFDIDFKMSCSHSIDAPKGIMSKEEFHEAYDAALSVALVKIGEDIGYYPDYYAFQEELCYMDASSVSADKLSLHITVPKIIFASNKTMKHFVVNRLLPLLPKSLVRMIDLAIYDEKHPLRAVLQWTPDTQRPLVIWDDEFHEVKDYISTAVEDHEYVVKYYIDEFKPQYHFHGSELFTTDDILYTFEDYFGDSHWRLTMSGNGLVYLNRKRPAYCLVCKKRHKSNYAVGWFDRNNKMHIKCMKSKINCKV
jgi:hypothetical protein